ncbi:flavodoxin family protein [Microbacterium sp. NPDC058269]|uniref:flavodoxin family protein n=1 Tax=Microbacterium sp. NPDC058269 TaxID=3346414 RepID=UPI0036DE4A77
MTTGHPQTVASTAEIVFESFFGNTRRVAEAVADGIRQHLVAALVDVRGEEPSSDHDVLVVGAPTHAHSLSGPASRREAESWAKDLGKHLTLEKGSRATGIREWIETGAPTASGFAAFDTRVDMPRIFTGSAATAISTRLRKRGMHELLHPESFLVDKDSRLLPGELERARTWGTALALEALSGSPAVRARW